MATRSRSSSFRIWSLAVASFVAISSCESRSGPAARDAHSDSSSLSASSAQEAGAASQPVGLAALSAADVQRTELWLALQGSGRVAALDASTGVVLHEATVGKKPAYVKVSPDGKWVAITDPPTATATVLDAGTGQVLRTLQTGKGPKGVNWSPDSKEIWVVNESAEPGTVWVYRAPGFERVAEVPVGRAPHNVVISEDGARAYVTSTGSANVTVVDARSHQPLDSIPVGGAAHNLTLSADGKTLYVTLTDKSQLALVDLAQRRVTSTIPLVVGHHVPPADGAGNLVVGGFGSGKASVIHLDPTGRATANDTVPLAPGAHGVALGPGDVAYVTDLADFVAVIDPHTARLERKIRAPGAPFTVSVRVVPNSGAPRWPSSRAAS
jgi:YVTN family beta-propeller protein